MYKYQPIISTLRVCIVCVLVTVCLLPVLDFTGGADKLLEIEQESDEETEEESHQLNLFALLAHSRIEVNHIEPIGSFPSFETEILSGFEREMINPPD